MNIWNKVFLGIIFIAAIGVLVFGAVEFSIRNTGQKKIADLEKAIMEKDNDIAKIVGGTDSTKSSVDKSPSALSFEETRAKTFEHYYERGRAWFDCRVRDTIVGTLPPKLVQMEAQVIITRPFIPNESGVETDVVIPEILKGVVYVFEERNENKGGAFLGRFRVDSEPTPTKFKDDEGNEKNGFQVKLITADPVSDDEITKIKEASGSKWAVYMTPPVDHVSGIFDQLTDEEKANIPEELREKFKADLTDEEKKDQNLEVVRLWEKYRKELDDPEAELAQGIAVTLDWLYYRRSSIGRDIEIVDSAIKTYKAATEKAESENEKLEGNCILEEKRVVAMDGQREKVKTLLEQYESEISKLMLQREKLQTLQAVLVAKIAECQLKIAEKIEAQTDNEEIEEIEGK